MAYKDRPPKVGGADRARLRNYRHIFYAVGEAMRGHDVVLAIKDEKTGQVHRTLHIDALAFNDMMNAIYKGYTALIDESWGGRKEESHAPILDFD